MEGDGLIGLGFGWIYCLLGLAFEDFEDFDDFGEGFKVLFIWLYGGFGYYMKCQNIWD